MMNEEYGKVSDEIKEMIIEDYLKKHPNVKRQEIVIKTINGKLVVDTVTRAFHRLAESQKQYSTTPKDKQIVSKLAQRNDVRYGNTLNSIASCNKYIDWLLEGTFFQFGEEESKKHKQFLEKKEQEAVGYLLEGMQVRKKLTAVMETVARKTASAVKVLLVEYLQAVMKQCKVQADVYNREIDLSKLLSEEVQQFIRSNFDEFINLGDSVLIEIGKTCQILRGESYEPILITSKDDYKKVRESLDICEARLQKIRNEIAETTNLVKLLEKYIEEVNQMDLDEPDPEPEPQPKQEDDSNPFRRMAYQVRNQRR